MYDTTHKWIARRATESGIALDQLKLDPENEREQMWEVFITFAGADDETIFLGDTLYGVNICDWLAEQCAYESACQDGGEEWTIEMYPAVRFDGDSPIYRVTDLEVPAATWMCTWNAGGDPASGCDQYANGLDGLCSQHRHSARVLEASAPAE